MPCESGPSYDDIQRERERLDAITRLACLYCQALEDEKIPIPTWAQSFWAQHKREDRARQAREYQENDAARLRAAANSKLTPEERHALGLK